MASKQSPQPLPAGVPASGKDLRPSDAGWVIRLLPHVFIALIAARIDFARLKASDIPARNRIAALQRSAISPDEALLADRFGFLTVRLSKRLPWRSDCVIQAIAVQDWLARRGIASEIRIGVEKPEDGPFGAHAWLVVGEQIITGGDIARYSLLLDARSGGAGTGESISRGPGN
jgi:hypothetical protein